MWIPRQTYGPVAHFADGDALGTPECSPRMEYVVGDRVSLCWRGRGRRLVQAQIVRVASGDIVVQLAEDTPGAERGGAPRAGDQVRVDESDVWYVELSR